MIDLLLSKSSRFQGVTDIFIFNILYKKNFYSALFNIEHSSQLKNYSESLIFYLLLLRILNKV